MRQYSCFLLDMHGAIRGAELLEAASDMAVWPEALRLLDSRTGFCDIEVWERNRQVALQNSAMSDETGAIEYRNLVGVTFRRLSRPADLMPPRPRR
ncbi:MAG: hypothetical protein WCC64_10060 [Aliidongia sp.]